MDSNSEIPLAKQLLKITCRKLIITNIYELEIRIRIARYNLRNYDWILGLLNLVTWEW